MEGLLVSPGSYFFPSVLSVLRVHSSGALHYKNVSLASKCKSRLPLVEEERAVYEFCSC